MALAATQKDEQRLLTVPDEIAGHVPCLPTGNDYVSLPTIRAADGAVERAGVLHWASASLIEVCGSPRADKTPAAEALLAPFLRVGGQELPLAAPRWRWLADAIPSFSWCAPDGALTVEGTICAPGEHKGFVYLLRLCAGRAAPVLHVTFGFRGQWGDTLQTVFSSGRVHGAHRVRRDRWSGGPVFEARPGPALLGWALMGAPAPNRCQWGLAEATAQEELVVAPGEPLAFELAWNVEALGERSVEVALFCGVGREGDGARTTAVHLARVGAARLLEEARADHERRLVTLPALGAEQRDELERVANRNLWFNRYFSTGRCIDTEERVAVTSRSPLYYVSAAFWSRDTLLWSLPGLLLVDREAAREVVRASFARHLGHPGEHAHYLDGALLYPGFELDELCAYVIGLQSYAEHAKDASIFEERAVAHGLAVVERALRRRRHREVALYETFLYPSDDPALYPYLAYDNALVALSWELFARLAERGWYAPAQGTAAAYREEAAAVRAAIREHLVVPGPRGPIFAWATDLGSPPRHALYDEPPGSLQLLAHYRLCDTADPLFRATAQWINSDDNPYWYGEGRFPGVGCPHAEHPFVMTLFNWLLAGRAEEAAEVLREAPLDGRLACESFDRETGEVKTGAAFATCAGFLGYAMWRAFGRPLTSS